MWKNLKLFVHVKKHLTIKFGDKGKLKIKVKHSLLKLQFTVNNWLLLLWKIICQKIDIWEVNPNDCDNSL